MGFPCEHCRSLADATHRRNGMPAPQGWDAALVITFVCTACLLGAYRYTDVRACFSPIQEGLRAPSARNATSLATTCNAVSSGPSSRGDPAMQVAMARHEAYEKDISDLITSLNHLKESRAHPETGGWTKAEKVNRDLLKRKLAYMHSNTAHTLEDFIDVVAPGQTIEITDRLLDDAEAAESIARPPIGAGAQLKSDDTSDRINVATRKYIDDVVKPSCGRSNGTDGTTIAACQTRWVPDLPTGGAYNCKPCNYEIAAGTVWRPEVTYRVSTGKSALPCPVHGFIKEGMDGIGSHGWGRAVPVVTGALDEWLLPSLGICYVCKKSIMVDKNIHNTMQEKLKAHGREGTDGNLIESDVAECISQLRRCRKELQMQGDFKFIDGKIHLDAGADQVVRQTYTYTSKDSRVLAHYHEHFSDIAAKFNFYVSGHVLDLHLYRNIKENIRRGSNPTSQAEILAVSRMHAIETRYLEYYAAQYRSFVSAKERAAKAKASRNIITFLNPEIPMIEELVLPMVPLCHTWIRFQTLSSMEKENTCALTYLVRTII